MSLANRLRKALDSTYAGGLLAGDLLDLEPSPPIPAAVLMAISSQQAPGIILTVRRDTMRTHAGQIAFPGGRIDPGEDPPAAALREASEELGLEPQSVEIVGQLPPYRTVTGYSVTPVIGVVPPALTLVPHEAEVADWFEAPLDYLIDPANQTRQSVLFRGRQRHYYEIDWMGRRIWGATAAMLINLSLCLGRR